jgi:hypothetical protein
VRNIKRAAENKGRKAVGSGRFVIVLTPAINQTLFLSSASARINEACSLTAVSLK